MIRRWIPALTVVFAVSISQLPVHHEAHAQAVIRNGVLSGYPPPVAAQRRDVLQSQNEVGTSAALTTEINFDEAPVPCVFIETTALRNAYQALGVVFSGPTALGGGAILDQCGSFGVSGYSPPNFVGYNQFAVMSDGGIPIGPERMSFSSDVSSVRVGVASWSGGTAILTAYSSTMVVLATASLSVTSTLQFLQVSAPGIRHVDLNVSNTDVWIFDDLSFEAAPPCPAVPMSFDLRPNTLNLRSMGRWVSATLEPEPPASPAEIDIASIRLQGSVPVDAAAPTSIGDADEDGRPDLNVKFDRAAVQQAIPEGEAVTVTITGEIGNGCFEATDVIRAIRGHVSAPTADIVVYAGSRFPVAWDTMAGLSVQWVAVLSSIDDGRSWKLEARDLPNTGSFYWTPPYVQTGQARIAVVLVESVYESGDDVEGVLGVSEKFSINSLVGVGDRGEVALSIRAATPHRADGRLRVEVSLPDASHAKLEVLDVTGRQLSTRQVGSLGAGTHLLDLTEGGAWRPGIYFLRLTQGENEARGKAVVIR